MESAKMAQIRLFIKRLCYPEYGDRFNSKTVSDCDCVSAYCGLHAEKVAVESSALALVSMRESLVTIACRSIIRTGQTVSTNRFN